MARVKICGLNDPYQIVAAADAGTDYIGYNFFPKSPRYVSPAEAATLAELVRDRVSHVALVVDPNDALLAEVMAVLNPDIIQLHGSETHNRVEEVQNLTGRKVMKAVGIAGPEDLARAQGYAAVADMLLIDAKPRIDDTLPGGNGRVFDWSLAKGFNPGIPWMLAGGLTPENVGQAIAASGAQTVDVASGVESAPGVKDPRLMTALCAAAKAV